MGAGLSVVQDSATVGDPGKPLMIFGFPPINGTTSSASPFVSKLETFLRMADIDYEATAGITGAPKGKVPYIKQGDVILGDSTFICEYLKNTYKGKLQLNEPDTEEKKAMAIACQRICEDHLYWGLLYYRWGTAKGFRGMMEYMSKLLPAPLSWILPRIVRRRLLKSLYDQGLSRHSENDVIFLLTSSMAALSGVLGEKRYVTGDAPCPADASVFGMLDNYLNDDLDLETARIVKRFPNLVRYVEDIGKAHYPKGNPSKLHPGREIGKKTKHELIGKARCSALPPEPEQGLGAFAKVADVLWCTDTVCNEEVGKGLASDLLREDSFDKCQDVCVTPRSETFMDCIVDRGVVSCHPLQEGMGSGWQPSEARKATKSELPDSCQEDQPDPGRASGRVPSERQASVETDGTEGTDEILEDCESFSEPGATDVIFVRDDVAVWPSRDVNSRIMGRLSLVKQHSVLFIAWLPYSKGALNEDGTFQLDSQTDNSEADRERGRTMYAVHPIPVSDIKAITRQTPTIGYHTMIIVLNSGLTLPPLYFYNGGVRSLISALREHVLLFKSASDRNTYLVNDTADPLQRSLNCLDLTDVLLGAPPPGASSTFHPSSLPGNGGAEVEMTEQSWKGLSFQLSERFSRITRIAKDTTSSFFGAGDGPDGFADLVPVAASMPSLEQLHSLEVPCQAVDQQPQSSFIKENDASHGGEFCPEGSISLCATCAEEAASNEAATAVGMFEVIDMQLKDESSTGSTQPWCPPVSLAEWATWFDGEGRLVDMPSFREKVFYGGVETGLRKEAWKFLLNYYPPESTVTERCETAQKKVEEYKTLKLQWTSISEAQERRFGKWRERKKRVDKDVCRTDRSHPFFKSERAGSLKVLRNVLLTYTMFNFDLGYCQGMSDLASPIVYVMCRDVKTKDQTRWAEVEAEAFWCFAGLMEWLECNFHTDQRGMHAQLVSLRKLLQLLDPQLYAFLERKDCLNFFFCFRWLLIHFKREFPFDEVLRLWEVLWSRHLSEHFHLYMCIAILMHHRRAIMDADFEFDELLKFCVELSGSIDLKATLRLAALLRLYIGPVEKECLGD
ncbi:unnamed protein product [Ostreobium quekettii]|uniref:Rab-GAP TBC domain-containing protein n=1 Tax=Ostreobium quekettii TaxID=121088 RepID=A0A8S1J2P2_9CHLO|nr:unnamed protein product [Ostreobium quekettii]